MPPTTHLAIDMGAESGRVIVGTLADGKLDIAEVHRFTHEAVTLPTGLHWDTTGILREITTGLRAAARYCDERRITPDTIGADTWGVDVALLDQGQQVLGLPYCYRDARTQATFDYAADHVGLNRIYRATGIQFMPFNTLYQLHATALHAPDLLTNAHRLLFMPDLIHFFLSGQLANERTIASTSQMLDPHEPRWAADILDAMGLPQHFLAEPVEPGTPLGTLLPALAKLTGLPESLRVVLPGSHDTASAIAAVPAEPIPTGQRPDWCYLSSGTWSLLGVERDTPDTSAAALDAGFTNEYGVGGKVRFLKNISGLYIVQEVRRAFDRDGQTYDYATLTQMAADAAPFATTLDANDPRFASPGDMPDKLRQAARETDQPVPETPGQLVRTALLS
ncbi:MAG: rhamnulokinase family protein, partial [Planctomycetota bacterium]